MWQCIGYKMIGSRGLSTRRACACGTLILGFQGKRMSDAFQAALKNCANMNAPLVTMSGRGIVTCAGGERLFTCVYVLVRILRETLNCTLPIQIWHFGGEELSPVMRWLLKPFDVELVDATSFLTDFPSAGSLPRPNKAWN
jgi:Mannosyltransferase putative